MSGQCLFVYGAHITSKSLLRAIKDVNPERVDELLSNMTVEQINQPIDIFGQTYLMHAVKTTPEIVQALLAKGADVNAENKQKSTALFIAAREGNVDTVKLLLAAGAQVNKHNDNGDTPVLIAAIHNKPAIITLLLQHGAAQEVVSKQGKSLKKLAKRSCAVQKGIDDFIASTHTVSQWRRINKNKNDELKLAIQAQDVAIIKNLFSGDEKPAINTPLDEYGRTALMYAIPGKKQIVQILLQEGALVNVQDADKMTALLYAVEYDRPDAIQLLLGAGASCLLEDAEGNGAFTLAKKLGNKKLQELLMKHCNNVEDIMLPLPATPSPVSDNRPQSRSLFDRSASASPQDVSLFGMFAKRG